MQFLSFLRSTHSKLKSLISDLDNERTETTPTQPNLQTDLKALSRGAYSGYDRDFQRLIGDSRSTLKRLTRSFFPDEVGDKEALAKNAYSNLYKINRGENSGYKYGGLSLPTEQDDAFNYALGGVRQQTINELIDIDYGGLDNPERTQRVNTALQKAYQTDQSSSYLSRPGVGPVLSMIGNATKEVTIDIFQLQNKVVSDALVEKAKQGVTINIRVAMPDGTEKDATGFSILGPNLIELEKFQRLKGDMEKDAAEGGRVKPDINLFVADKKSHPKVILTDKEAMLGTLNLTQPVGSDPSAAGGNFEAIRRLTRGIYSPDMLIGSEGNAEERSAKLYYQLRSVYHDESKDKQSTPLAFMEQGGTKPAFTDQSQIVGPGEIYKELRYALELAGDTSAKQWRGMYAILNQPFLLMLDDPMHRGSMQGEMGKFNEQTNLTDPLGKRALEYRDTQRKLFDLINQDKAFITVDNRGYIEKVINPMYERVEKLISGFDTEYGGSLETLVKKLGGSGNYEERLHKLTRSLRDKNNQFDMDTARQLLAMTSGNIKLSTATMQHVKSFAVMERQGQDMKAISYYMGSSNLGAYSMSITPGDEKVVNREIGIAFSMRALEERLKGNYSLSEQEIKAELETAREYFSQQWAGLTHKAIGMNLSSPGSKAWYEGRVHSKGLIELNQKLKAIGEGLGPGFNTHYIYGGNSGTERIGLEVGIDIGKLTGTGLGGKFNLRYSVLQDMSGGQGFVYDLSTGKVISRSLLHNSSKEGIQTPFGELSDNIKYQILDPVSTTLNLVSTFTAEAMNRVHTWGPEGLIKDMETSEKLGLVLDYLDFKVSGKKGSNIKQGTPGMFFLNAPSSKLEEFSNHLENLGVSKDSSLEKVKKLQAFTGGMTPDAKQSSHQYLSEALGFIDMLSASRGGGTTPEHWQMLKGGAGRGIAASLVNLLDTSPEFLLDVFTTMAGGEYEPKLRKSIQAFRDSLMEPFLYLGDISKYSGAQGWHRLPVYHITDDMVNRIKQAGPGMQGLLTHTLMVPSLYDPSSDLGINEIWRSIASKSTINEGIDEAKGATLYNRKGSQVGDVMYSRLGVSLGVSYETKASDIQKYLQRADNLKVQRLLEDRFRGQESTNTYTFDTKGKLASIPQRLKNVSGQKGLMHMTEIAQGILDIERAFLRGEAPIDAIAKLRNQGSAIERAALSKLEDRDINLTGYMETYTQTLKELVSGLRQDASHLITDDMGLAALYGGNLRTVMGPDHLAQLQTYADYVETELGEEVDTDNKNLAYYVLQAKAVAADMLASGQKGFIGGRVQRPLVLLQMSGAYTDNFFANKDYGGGVREGFVETKTIRLRASKLGHEWSTSEHGLLAMAGDLISFDRDRNQVIVHNAQGLQRSLTIGEDISNERVLELAKNMRGQVVDDRAQVMVLDNVIESLHRGEGNSTAQKGVSSYAATRQGEDAIDYLLSVKALPGVTSTGNMEYEFQYASSIMPGGGRRVEGATSGGLFKAVGIMSDISGILEQRVAGLNDGLTSSIDRVNIQDVFGVVNISNLKSYFYSHGAGILRDAKGVDPNRLSRVVNKSSGQLVAGLMLHFGDAWVGEASGDVAKALVEFMGRGELGEYHKSLVTGLLIKHRGDVEKVGRELLGHKKVGGVFTSDLDKYNITQLPGLANFSKQDVLQALSVGGDNNQLAKRLGSLAGVEEGKLSKNMKASMKLAIDLSNPLHRQASILLTSWDITAQLSSRTHIDTGELYLGNDTEGNRNLMKVASIMGFDPLRIQKGLTATNEDTEYAETARNIAIGLSSKVSSVFLEMDLNYSVTKEPSGKKHTGNIEGVQMVKPFLNLATQFRKEGGINQLKLIIGNLMAGMSLGETATNIAGQLQLENTLGSARNLMDPLQQEIGGSHKFLGLYGSGTESIEELRGQYSEYEKVVKTVLEQRLSLANDKSKLIFTETDQSRRSVLMQERDALLQEASKLMLEYEDPNQVKDLLGAEFKPEYSKLINKVKAIGERYDALSSKPMGVGLGNAIVGNMKHDRAILFMPELTITGQEEGRVIMKVDSKRGNYTYLPSGEDLGVLGTQYGAHVDEIVMATIKLTGALTPGTAMSKVMQKLKAAELVGSDRISLSGEEAALLHEYQEAFIGMTSLLAEKGSGSRVQAATSGKTTLGGGVTTPAPSWWVPEGSILLSKETLRKQGVNDSERARGYVATQRALEELPKTPDNWTRRGLLKAKADALLNGLSEAGIHLISRVREERETLSNIFDAYKAAERAGDINTTIELHSRAKMLISESLGQISSPSKTPYRNIIPRNKEGKERKGLGDEYVVKIGELEMEYFIEAFGGMEDLKRVQDYGSIIELKLNKLIEKAKGLGIEEINRFDRGTHQAQVLEANQRFFNEKIERKEKALPGLQITRERTERALQYDYEVNALEHLKKIIIGESRLDTEVLTGDLHSDIRGQSEAYIRTVKREVVQGYLSSLEPELNEKLTKVLDKSVEIETKRLEILGSDWKAQEVLPGKLEKVQDKLQFIQENREAYIKLQLSEWLPWLHSKAGQLSMDERRASSNVLVEVLNRFHESIKEGRYSRKVGNLGELTDVNALEQLKREGGFILRPKTHQTQAFLDQRPEPGQEPKLLDERLWPSQNKNIEEARRLTEWEGGEPLRFQGGKDKPEPLAEDLWPNWGQGLDSDRELIESEEEYLIKLYKGKKKKRVIDKDSSRDLTDKLKASAEERINDAESKSSSFHENLDRNFEARLEKWTQLKKESDAINERIIGKAQGKLNAALEKEEAFKDNLGKSLEKRTQAWKEDYEQRLQDWNQRYEDYVTEALAWGDRYKELNQVGERSLERLKGSFLARNEDLEWAREKLLEAGIELDDISIGGVQRALRTLWPSTTIGEGDGARKIGLFSYSEDVTKEEIGLHGLSDLKKKYTQRLKKAQDREYRLINEDRLQKTLEILSGMASKRREKSSKLKTKIGYLVKEGTLERIDEDINNLEGERDKLISDRDRLSAEWTSRHMEEVDSLIEEYRILTEGTEEEKRALLSIQSTSPKELLESTGSLITEGKLGELTERGWQGKAKGELSVFSFSRESLNKLSPEGKRRLVKDRLGNLISQYTDLDRYLTEVETITYGIGPEGQRLITSGGPRADLKELITTLSSIDLGDESVPIDVSINMIETSINKLDTTEVLQTITFRNAPFGSTETQRQAFSVLEGIGELNEYINQARERMGAAKGVVFDETRNQTMTLLNPLSQTTLNAGDWDGDNYTSIFTDLAKFHKEARRVQDVITTHQVIISETQAELKREQDKYQALGPQLTEDQEKTLLMARTDLSKKIQESQDEISTQKELLNKRLFDLEQAKAAHTDKYGDAIRREVADYLGVDKRMFMGKDKGGFLDQDIDLSILPTFIQQGHGLFGGLKDKAPLAQEFAGMLTGLTEAYLNVKGDKSKLMQEGHKYLSEDNWKVFRDSEMAREDLLKEVRQITSGVDITGDLDIALTIKELRPLAEQRAGALRGDVDTMSAAEKLMKKSQGASISDDMYSMLSKVLGKAGGDILGRTFNTLVGTLFADSPLIAMSHLLTSNEQIKAQVTTQLASFMQRKIDAGEMSGEQDGLTAANKFLDNLQGESERAMGLQQFMKNAQQLLRDSLKFKKANDTIEKLAESLDKYNAPIASEETRRDLIANIAGQLGPSPGLRAFMQLEDLVSLASEKGLDRDVKALMQQDGGREWEALSKSFNISKSNLESELLPEMELTRKAFGIEGGGTSVREILEYKVARDLQNLIAANRMGLSDDAGDAWHKTLMQGAEGLLDSLGIQTEQEGRVLDIHKRTKLAFEGADEKAQVRLLRANQVMELGWYEKGQSTDKLIALLSHIENSFNESAEAFGYTGERLKRMTTLRIIGKSLTNMAAGREGATPTLIGDDQDLITGDVLTTMLQLSASNKLTPEASGQFMNLLGALASQAPEDAGRLFMALNAVSPKDANEKHIYNVLNEFLHSVEGMGEIELGESKALFKEGVKEYVEQGLDSSSTGGKSDFLSKFIKSFNDLAKKSQGGDLMNSYPEMVKLMREHLSKQVNPTAGEFMPKYHFSTPEREAEAQAKAGQRVAVAAAKLQDQIDMGAGLGIALMSSLLFTGGISAETAKEAISGTVMAVGYSKSGNRGWLGGIGGSFRMRMAAMEGAATGNTAWAGQWIMRETMFTLGALAGNVLIQKTKIDEKLVKGIAKVFGSDVKPMDFDKFASWRGTSGAVAGALLSALMGSMGAMLGTQLASGVDNFLPLLGALDSAVQNSKEMSRQADERVAVLQAEGVNLSAPDDPLAEFIQVSYELAEGIDDRTFGDYEEQYATLAYNDSDMSEMPEAEVMLT